MGTLAENDRMSGPWTAEAGQTDFPANFPLFRDAAGEPIGVYLSRTRAGVETVLSLGDFTIPAETDNGFTLQLVVPALAGDVYVAFGSLPRERDREHAPATIRRETLEADAVSLQAQLQEDKRDLDRSVRAPLGEAGLTLPPVSSRKNKVLAFDAAGKASTEMSVDDIAASVISQILGVSPAVQAAVESYLASKSGGVWYSGDGEPTEDVGSTGDFYRQTDTDPRQVWYRSSTGWSIERDVYAATTSAVTIPAGAIGVWFFDEVQTDDGVMVVPNQITKVATPPSPNMIPNPRRFWDTSLFVNVNDASKAPTSEYMQVDTGATGYIQLQAADYEAGTYTIVVDAERDAGTDQTFRIGWYPGDFSPDLVATAARQRFKFTATLDAGANITMLAYEPVAGTDHVKLKIHDVAIYKGTEDLEPDGTPFAGHMVIGKVVNDAGATVEAWGVDMGTTPTPATIQLPESVDLKAFTLIVLYKNITATDFHSFLSAKNDYAHFDLMERRSSTASKAMAFQHGAALHLVQRRSMYPSLGLGWRSMAIRLDALGNAAIFNGKDKALFDAEAAPATYNALDLFFNATTDYFYAAGMAYAAAILAPTAWTDAQVRQGILALEQRYSGLVVAPAKRKLIAEGDSITAFGIYATDAYAEADDTLVVTWAVGGSTMADLTARAPRVDTIPALDTPAQQSLCAVLIGANDLNEGYVSPNGWGAGSAGYLAEILNYHAQRKAAGYITVAGTILNRGTVPGFDTLRNAVNAGLRAEAADPDGVIDYIVDFAADPDIGTAAAIDDLTYFDADRLHPNATGQAKMTEIAVAVIDSIPLP